MNLIELTLLSLLTAAISSTCLICLLKWGIVDKIELHTGWRCVFCLGFWLNVIGSIIIFFIYTDLVALVIIPFAAASITIKIWK